MRGKPAEPAGAFRPRLPGPGRASEVSTPAPEPRFRETLPPVAASVPRARHLVWRFVSECRTGVDGDAAGLATSELVTNAIRHAGTAIDLLVRVGPGLRVEVSDGRPDRPLRRPGAGGPDVSGRGLYLVAVVAARWGVAYDASTKTVWFELDRAPPGPDRVWPVRPAG